MNEQRQDVFRVADEIFRQGPVGSLSFAKCWAWMESCARFILPRGRFRHFEQTDEYQKSSRCWPSSARTTRDCPAAAEPTRVITVRLPKSLHESLRAEAHDRKTSMNKLCIRSCCR